MIVGLGIDIAEVNRLEDAISRHGRHFVERVFTAAEIAYSESHKNTFERYAARFAAKEAAMKALGTGWRRGIRWVDIEVVNLPGGKPTLRLAGVAASLAAQLGVSNIVLSMTHTASQAMAEVILEGQPPR